MSVGLLITCDRCDGSALVEPDFTGVFDASILVSDGRFVLETSWEDAPAGWVLEASGVALCPDCQETP